MRVAGLISGTSHDGIDAAVADFSLRDNVLYGTIVYTATTPYDPSLRSLLRSALPPANASFATLCALDTLIGQAFAAAAVSCGPVDLICSHGQTVYHWIESGAARGTLQIGHPSWIASATGVPVISGVRAADIAAGGQGAPLVPLLDLLLLPPGAAALNLGGIANITVCSDPPLAYDIGPANALIDAAVYRVTGGRLSYDDGGRIAASSSIDVPLLNRLLSEPYYAMLPPKSTGKELFNDAYIADLPIDRLVATVTALTAETVATEVIRHDVTTLVVSGGGIANPVLMSMLSSRLPGVTITPSDAYGVPSDAKEALAFALLGWMTAHGLPGNVPACTGAASPVILGSLTPASAALPVPVPAAPKRLVLR